MLAVWDFNNPQTKKHYIHLFAIPSSCACHTKLAVEHHTQASDLEKVDYFILSYRRQLPLIYLHLVLASSDDCGIHLFNSHIYLISKITWGALRLLISTSNSIIFQSFGEFDRDLVNIRITAGSFSIKAPQKGWVNLRRL